MWHSTSLWVAKSCEIRRGTSQCTIQTEDCIYYWDYKWYFIGSREKNKLKNPQQKQNRTKQRPRKKKGEVIEIEIKTL